MKNHPLHIKIDVSIQTGYLYEAILIAEQMARDAFGSFARIQVSYDGKQKSFDEVNEDE